ncbi:MAG: aminotransferase class III-fold pyridoxal phosphate-dependent enzyme [Bythopirellula sp.]
MDNRKNTVELLRRIQSFIPPNSFDAHAHLYHNVDASDSLPKHVGDENGQVGCDAWQQTLAKWMGDRVPSDGLFFGDPQPSLNFESANRFVAAEVAPHPDSRALMLIRPQDDPEVVKSVVQKYGFIGFKVYHVYADRPDTFNAATGEFLPDWAWEIADRYGLTIMLHMVGSRALADSANQEYIRTHCRQYPEAHLILAHAARGFCAQHTVEGVNSIRGLDNVFFDTSAICEPASFEAILRVFGPTRLMFGTDFPVSEIRGRCVSIGDGFLWLGEENVAWESSAFAKPELVGVESILALQTACRTLRLNDSDVEKIFGAAARQMLGIAVQASDEKTQSTYERAKQLMPGGTQLLSKRPEMYAPDCWPGYFSEARGCEVIDLDDRRFIDMTTSGIGSCLLGYADHDVTEAVVRRVQLGSMSSLNAPEEVELAELLVALHPWSDQVRYCRTGGESMAAAVRIARASTGRDRVAFCGYHGWSDWYLAANLPDPTGEMIHENDPLQSHLLPGLAPTGVPSSLGGTALPFAYNRLDELQQIVNKHKDQIAAVVMEPLRYTEPEPGFLESVRELCNQCGAILIFDEITSGWRFRLGGIHLEFGIDPDLTVFAKAIGNGHPMGAIVGRAKVMEAAQSSFISSTYWSESVGPTAALAALRKMQQVDVPAHVNRIGESFRSQVLNIADQHNLPVVISGRSALLHLSFDHPEVAALTTLFTTRMLSHGLLASSGFYPSLAHTEENISAYCKATDKVFSELAEGIQQGTIQQRLQGAIKHTGFARLT